MTSLDPPRGIAKSLAWVYLSSLIQAFSKIAVLAVMARLLAPEDFGLLGIALIFTNFAERIGQIGVGPALIQKEVISNEDVRAGQQLGFISGVLICVALFFSAGSVAEFFKAPAVEPVLQFLAFGFIIDGAGLVSDALLNRRLRFKELMFAENVAYVFGHGVVGVTLAYRGHGVWALVIATLTARLIRNLIMIWYEPQKIDLRCDPGRILAIGKFGMGFSLGKLLNFFSVQGDNFVVARVLGVDALGMYTRAYQLMTLPAVYLGQVLERVLFPAMARRQADPKQLQVIFFRSLEVVTLVALPVSVCMYLLAGEIISVLFGARWKMLNPVLEILAFGVFFRTAYKSSDTLVRAMGAVYRHAARQAIYTALVIGGSIAGSLWFGLEGVALAVVFAVAVNYVLMSHLSAQFLGTTMRQFLGAHLSGVWLSTVVTATLALALPLLRVRLQSDFLVLVTGAVLVAIVTAITLAFSPEILRPRIFAHLTHYFPVGRYGVAGRCVRWVLRASRDTGQTR